MASIGERRRHYRVARKQVNHEDDKCFLGYVKKHPSLIFGGIVVLILAFIKGLIIGLWISRD